MGSSRERGFSLTPERLAFIEQKMREMGIESREALAKAANLSRDVIYKKLFSGKNLDRSTVEAIAKALKIQPTELVEPDKWYRRSKTAKSQASINIDWKQVCQDVLELRRKMLLTSHPLGAARRVQDVYVPLELVERQSKPRLEQDLNPERFSVREQEEKTTPISHNEFFDSVLKDQSPKSQGKRIAIIGEPGAGKTTLLQEISTKLDGIPIWIDLASLKRDDTLDDYLLHNWLKSSLSLIRRYAPEAVTNLLEPSTELKQAFTQLFEQNQVWLLLDGADEMSAELGLPLNWVAQQLRQPGWVAKAKVVLTSRLNLWSTDGDRLLEFDTYRNLDFESKQVIEFIDKWFAEEPDAREKLKEDLAKSSDRIKSLIRNPLRLTLLCITWKGVGDRLPETKAGLYQRLVHSHYEHQWKTKPEDFAQFLDEEEQDKLNQWLGELSKTALDGKDSHFQGGRFRFRKSTLTYFAKQSEQGSDFLKWALKLEWLHQIGLPSTDELDADEPIYAFIHPTFQEYFAAQSIPTFAFFLNHNNQEPNPFKQHNEKDCVYRIFEPQWREVILLWLGLPSEKIPEQQKENLIASLVTFNSGCGNTFTYRGLLLAVAGLGEFKNCKSTFTVIALLMRNCFCYFQEMEEPSRAALYETDQTAAVVLLSILALTGEDEYVRCESGYLLGKLNPGNEIAIQAFNKLIESTQDEWNLNRYASKLLEIDSDNELAINTLIRLFKTANDEQLKEFSRWDLGKAEYGNETVISCFIDSIKNKENIDYFYEVLNELEKVGQHQPRVINFLIELISNIQDEEIHYDIIYGFGGIAPSNEFAIIKLERLIQQSKADRVLLHAACCLNQITINSSLVIYVLNKLSHSAANSSHQLEAILTLLKIDSTNYTALDSLSKVIQGTENKSTIDYIFETIYESLESDSQVLNSLISPLSYLCQTSVEENIKRIAASHLGEINPGNQVAVQTLLDITQNSKDEDIRVWAATDLGEIDPGNKIATQTLLELIKYTESDRIRMQAASSLGKIDPGNYTAIKTLLALIQNTDDEDICGQAARLLEKIEPGNLVAIRTLTRLIISSGNESDTWKMIWDLGHIKSNLEAVIYALVKIIKTTNNEAVIRNAFERIQKISHGNKVAIKLISKVINYSQNSNVVLRASECLIKILRYDQFPDILSYIQSSLSFKEHPEHKAKFVAWYPVIWHCTQNMSYPDFYRAWHISPSSDTKLLE